MSEKNEKTAKIKKLLAEIETKKIELPEDVQPETPEADKRLREARKIAEQIKQKRYAA